MNEWTILTPLGGIWCFQDGDFPDVVQSGTSKTSMGITLTINLVETNCWFSLSEILSQSDRGRGPRFCISIEHPGDAGVVGPRNALRVALLLRTLPQNVNKCPQVGWARPCGCLKLEKQWAHPGASGNHGQIQIAACFYSGCEWRMVFTF